MIRAVGASAFLAIALVMPVQDAAAQDPVGGAILGGAAGAILGGAMGGGRGAAVGAIIGGATGAAIAAQGAARPYHNGCYRQRPDGAWLIVAPEYRASPPEPVAGDFDGGDDGYRRGPHYGGGQCRELRQACLHKEELGEQGMGNCRRYREICR